MRCRYQVWEGNNEAWQLALGDLFGFSVVVRKPAQLFRLVFFSLDFVSWALLSLLSWLSLETFFASTNY